HVSPLRARTSYDAIVAQPARTRLITPLAPAVTVIYCPLGIWIASQSRLNVNSVFSYMASTSTLYYATDAKNDEIRITNDETMSNSPKGWLSAFFRFDHSFVLRHSCFII